MPSARCRHVTRREKVLRTTRRSSRAGASSLFQRRSVLLAEMDKAPVLLVVDDDPDVREIMKLTLEAEGFVVVEADNGQAALDQLHAGLRPRLIILDLMMPVMSGWEFWDRHQATPALKNIPVVIFTATGLNTGAVGPTKILPKPVDLPHLLREIRGYVDD